MPSSDPFIRRLFSEDESTNRAFYRAIKLRLPEVRHMLDVGCGRNDDLARYRRAGRLVWGTDFQRHPELAEKEWFRLLPANGKIPFEDGSLDLVCSSWVLEHVNRPDLFLAEVHRVLRPGGWFISRTVNGGHYVAWISRLMRLFPHATTQALVHRLYGRHACDTFPTYYRMNSPAQLQKAARAAGFEVVELKGQANQGYFAFSRWLRRAAALADFALDRLRPGLGRIYLVATLRKPAADTRTAAVAARKPLTLP